jgi:hypothetical protein
LGALTEETLAKAKADQRPQGYIRNLVYRMKPDYESHNKAFISRDIKLSSTLEVIKRDIHPSMKVIMLLKLNEISIKPSYLKALKELQPDHLKILISMLEGYTRVTSNDGWAPHLREHMMATEKCLAQVISDPQCRDLLLTLNTSALREFNHMLNSQQYYHYFMKMFEGDINKVKSAMIWLNDTPNTSLGLVQERMKAGERFSSIVPMRKFAPGKAEPVTILTKVHATRFDGSLPIELCGDVQDVKGAPINMVQSVAVAASYGIGMFAAPKPIRPISSVVVNLEKLSM